MLSAVPRSGVAVAAGAEEGLAEVVDCHRPEVVLAGLDVLERVGLEPVELVLAERRVEQHVQVDRQGVLPRLARGDQGDVAGIRQRGLPPTLAPRSSSAPNSCSSVRLVVPRSSSCCVRLVMPAWSALSAARPPATSVWKATTSVLGSGCRMTCRPLSSVVVSVPGRRARHGRRSCRLGVLRARAPAPGTSWGRYTCGRG